MKINRSQQRVLEWGESGFTTLTKVSVYDRALGITIYTITGMLRRGWLWKNSNGIIRITAEGKRVLAEAEVVQKQ